MKLTKKAVERLSRYRRELLKYRYLDKPHIVSSDLARILDLSPEQVRQDLMLTSFTAETKKKGYDINELIECISQTIDPDNIVNVVFIGKSSLIKVVESYIEEGGSKLNIEAIFDFTISEKYIEGIPCYSIDKLDEVVKNSNIELAVLAISSEFATEIADVLIINGIKGILNLTSVNLGNPSGVIIENYDIISSLEKLSYFINSK